MKTGVLTIHRATNYGAVLQAFALKTYLEKLGVETEIIDYRSKHIEDLYVNMFADYLSVKTKIKNVLTWNEQKERNSAFKSFIEKELGCTDKTSLFSRQDMLGISDKYDCFITGSDQIWNPFCTGNDKTYFLDFISDNKKKYSYAASLGNIKNGFIQSDEYRSLLKNYSELSVREEKGKKAVEEMTQKSASVHLDPTFLLEKEDWNRIIKPVNKSNYVLVYSLTMPETIERMAREYAKENNKEIVFITLNNLYSKKHKKEVITCSPEEFVSYFYYADAVFTNSFHGTAFSIIFEKEFFVEKNANPNHDNSRLTNVLDKFGLEDRMVVSTPQKAEIDYGKVNDRLRAYKEESYSYLKNIIEREIK